MEHFTDIGQSIEEGLARQKRELQEAGFIPDISSAGHLAILHSKTVPVRLFLKENL